ncbi:MAG: LysM peptidoglycan-binding domain-containing protein [Tenericutes bacterium]|nr:LysM peptidoglycan-binding domain-containing protein [Mycoplasmatota bacterium]
MNSNTYVVQKGDTLYGISKQFNTSMQRLRELNNLSSDILTIGKVLIVSPNSDSNPSECVTYTVKKGDSLYSIAKQYNSTVDAIKRYNNLTSNNLSIGQKLKLPCYMKDNDNTTMPNFVMYTVKAGDSLYSIAQQYNTTVDKIKSDNKLTSNTLSIGQVLMIADKTTDATVEECFGEDEVLEEDYVIYVVKPGDNLYSIARKYDTTVSELKRLNNLTSNNLSVGQELKIPNERRIYVVKRGDSLYSIANMFNTTVSAIKSKNNLTTNNLSIGQELII